VRIVPATSSTVLEENWAQRRVPLGAGELELHYLPGIVSPLTACAFGPTAYSRIHLRAAHFPPAGQMMSGCRIQIRMIAHRAAPERWKIVGKEGIRSADLVTILKLRAHSFWV
jgi:hypothetical protein